MSRPARRLRADDVLRIQAERGGDIGYELVNGELVPIMPASLPHGRIMARLGRHMDWHVSESRLGVVYTEAGFVLDVAGDPERLRGPDIAFLSNQTLEAAGGEPVEGFFRGAPDLAVEVQSPNDRKGDLQQRVREFLDAGAKLVWTIHPAARSAMVFRPDGSARLLRETEALDGEDVLSGFRLPLAELFS
jgi:Uma2 family endonuclease